MNEEQKTTSRNIESKKNQILIGTQIENTFPLDLRWSAANTKGQISVE